MDRRSFLSIVGALWASPAARDGQRTRSTEGKENTSDITAAEIPRWRGFNLQAELGYPGHPAFQEFDFASMREWGFDFARLPLSYWMWGSPEDWKVVREEPLKQIDRAVEFGKQYGIHVNINFHRIPGYCINQRELEPADLFSGKTDERERALKAAAYHWKVFAERYKGIPNRQLSFDLVNEPPKMRSNEGYLEERYVEIVHRLVKTIREVDPKRLIFADGMNIGQLPVLGIANLGLVQSTRGYQPKAISHYTATWVPLDEFETMKPPTWPLADDKGRVWDREQLKRVYVDQYQALMDRHVEIHVGEWGCFNQTPHAVTLAWMRDCLSVWKEAGWGNALWNLRGSFGVLDSERSDVKYEAFKGHRLDRQMLELLREY